MTDATPRNRQLIYTSPRDFKAVAQFHYGLHDPSVFATGKWSTAVMPQLSKHMMIRNLDELKRLPLVHEIVATATPHSTRSGPQFPATPFRDDDSSSVGHDDDVLPPLNDHDDWEETSRWDSNVFPTGGTSVQNTGRRIVGRDAWGWPAEALYQSYHVVVAIDFSKSSFEVSRNGCVFVDRVPSAVSAILESIRVTLETRRSEVESIRAWTAAHLAHDLHLRDELLSAVWDPVITVSLVLVNTPLRYDSLVHHGTQSHKNSSDYTSAYDESEVPFNSASSVLVTGERASGLSAPVASSSRILSPSNSRRRPSAAATSPPCRDDNASIRLLPTNVAPFGLLDDSSDFSVERTVPLLLHCNAHDLLLDATFPLRLAERLREYENYFRDDSSAARHGLGAECEWPEATVAETIERALRFVPFDDDACHSVAVVSNFAVAGCGETIALLEGQVLRKNVVLSCLSLNRFVPWDSPHLTALGHFLIACGGFGIDVDQWTALSKRSVTVEWNRRFEGSRCLAQQLFVHYISKFPVVAPAVSQRLGTIIPSIATLPCLTESTLADVFKGPHAEHMVLTQSAAATMRILAEARVNEGWSVVADTAADASTGHLYARLDHFLHRGSLTLYYEVDIVPPVMYRRLRVQGTHTLVRYFSNLQLDDRIDTSAAAHHHSGRNWQLYLLLLRGLVEAWMRADEDTLGLYSPLPRQVTKAASQHNAAISNGSRLAGCTAEWLNRACVRSLLINATHLAACDKLFSVEVTPSVPAAKKMRGAKAEWDALRCVGVRGVCDQALAAAGFCPTDDGSSKVPSWVRSPASSDDTALAVVQVFLMDEHASAQSELLSGIVEVRVSCFGMTATEQDAVMSDVHSGLAAYAAQHNAACTVGYRLTADDVKELRITACVARRALCMAKHDLLSTWSDASSTSSAPPSQSTRTNTAARVKKTTKTAAKNTVQNAGQKWFVLGAHGSELLLMRGTVSVRWTFQLFSSRTQHVTAAAFGMLLHRRLKSGFDLLHACVGGRRALLRKTNVPLTGCTVTVHDIVEVDLSEGAADVRIVRHLSPVDGRSLSEAQLESLCADIGDDYCTVSVVSALFYASSTTLHAAASRTTAAGSSGVVSWFTGGTRIVDGSMAVLVPLLSRQLFEERQWVPVAGPMGAWEVDRSLHHFVSCLGDESVVVPTSKLHPTLSQWQGTSVLVARLAPRKQFAALTFLLVECPSNRPQSSAVEAPRPAPRLLLGSFDVAAAVYALCAQLNIAPPRAVVDPNGMRAVVQRKAVLADQSLIGSVLSTADAYVSCVNARCIQRSMIHNIGLNRRSGPTTPVFGPQGFPRTDSVDAALHNLEFPSPSSRSAVSELINAFDGMMTYAKPLDVSFLAKLAEWDSGAPRAGELLSRILTEHVVGLRRVESDACPMFFLDPTAVMPPVQDVASPAAPSPHTADDAMAPLGESWELASDVSRETDGGGEVCDIGVLEAEHVPSVTKFLLCCELSDGTLYAEWIGAQTSESSHSPTPSVTVRKATLLVLHRTLPDALFDLARNRFRPPAHVVRRLLSETLAHDTVTPVVRASVKAAADFDYTPGVDESGKLFFTGTHISTEQVAQLQMEKPLSILPEVCFASVDRILLAVADAASRRALERANLCPPLVALNRMTCEEALGSSVGSREQSPVTDFATSPPVAGVSKDSFGSPLATTRQRLVHTSRDILDALRSVENLRALCQDVVAPAITCCPPERGVGFLVEEFQVEFTRIARRDAFVDPFEATQRVFSKVLVEEGFCAIPIDTHSYFFVPHGAFRDQEIIVVSLLGHDGVHIDAVRIYCFAPPNSTFAVKDVCSILRQSIRDKVLQISQIHLLKELRDRQTAPEELIPPRWGDQFTPATEQQTAAAAAAVRNASFLPKGATILEIPLYYKLQHQSKKILSRILTNCVKLELLPIYNQEQCFVVADDVKLDTFHCIRLVFAKSSTAVSPAAMPPVLTPSDRCQMLVVQMYSPSSHPQVHGALTKLQDFCYLLAIQELQSHLNYVQRKDLHADDWTFLRYEKRDPIVVDMTFDGAPWHSAYQILAKWLLLRNMQESKFKLIASREALLGIQLPSSFLAHYQLHKGTNESVDNLMSSVDLSAIEPAAPDTASTPVGRSEAEEELRFVKQVEGPTNVLLSCGVQFLASVNKIRVDVFCTKRPHDASRSAEALQAMTQALQSCVADTVLQVLFFIAAQRTSPSSSGVPKLRSLHMRHVLGQTQRLMAMADDIAVPELSALKRRSIDMRGISATQFGPLLERLTGLLQPMGPTYVFTHSASAGGAADGVCGSVTPVFGYPWSWMEELQSNVKLDHLHFFVLCGFSIVDDCSTLKSTVSSSNPSSPCRPSTSTAPLPPTRALPASHPAFPVSKVSCVEAIAGVPDAKKDSPELQALHDSPKVLLHLNVREGADVVVFNLRDSDQVLNLVELVVSEAVQKSAMHRDVLLQSLGHLIPTPFTEQRLAHMCCGDQRNVHAQVLMHIEGETVHRGATVSRFPKAFVPSFPSSLLSPASAASPPNEFLSSAAPGVAGTTLSDAFSFIVTGLNNRGTMVNYVFPYDAAVKVLFSDEGSMTVAQCRQAVERLIDLGVFELDESPLFGLQQDSATVHHAYGYMTKSEPLRTYRIASHYSQFIPHGAMIASVYHRHLQRAHILIEAKNARTEVSDGLLRFEKVWKAPRGARSDVGLARNVIQLQLKSKQAYGARLPEFSLRSEHRLGAEDMYLDPQVPTSMSNRDLDFCKPVDRILQQYMRYLQSVFACAQIIDIDPAQPEFTSDADIAKRLKCRYGKVYTADGFATFTPHLYFAVMSVADAVLAVRSGSEKPSQLPPPGTSGGGYLVIEVGFQVVNYALDFFVVGGTESVHAAGGGAAPDLNIIATLVKQKLLFSSVLYDLQVNSLKGCAQLHTAVLPGVLPLSVALQNLTRHYPSPPSFSLNVAHVFAVTDAAVLELRSIAADDGAGQDVRFLIPRGSLLRRESTQERYECAGVLVWTDDGRPLLYVLLATERQAQECQRVGCRDMQSLLAEAKVALVRMLVESTTPLRVGNAWKRLASGAACSPDALQLLQAHCYQSSENAQLAQILGDGDTTDPSQSYAGGIATHLAADAALVNWDDIARQMLHVTRLAPSSVRLHRIDAPAAAVVSPDKNTRTPHGTHYVVAASTAARVCCVLTVHATPSCAPGCVMHLSTWYGDGAPRDPESPAVEARSVCLESLLRVVASAVWNTMTL